MNSFARTSFMTAMVSAASVLSGLVKNKYVAVLLGSAGIGLAGLVNNAATFAASILGLGYPAGEVMFVTRNMQAGRPEDISAALKVYRLALLVLTAVIFVACFLLWPLINRMSEHWTCGSMIVPSALVSAACYTFSAIEASAITGMRRFSLAATANIVGIFIGLFLVTVLSWLYGVTGLLYAIPLAAAAAACVNHVCVRTLGLPSRRLDLAFVSEVFRSRFRSASAFFLAGLVPLAAQFIIRQMIAGGSGLSAVGNYQAAWGICVLYSGFLVSALGSDFYTGIVSAASEGGDIGAQVDAQFRSVICLVTPIIVVLLGFGRLLVPLMYTPDFGGTVALLRFQLLGDLFRVSGVVFALCFMALGQKKIHIVCQATIHLAYLGLAFFCGGMARPEALGASMSACNLLGFVFMFAYARKFLGFSLRAATLKLLVLCCILISLSFVSDYVNQFLCWSISSLIILGFAMVALKVFCGKRVSLQSV